MKGKIVMAFGTFDLLHPGHLHYLKEAKKLGKELVVVVARDESVKAIKGHYPAFNEQHRLRLVSSLKFVNKAVLGHDFVKDKTGIVKEFSPDIIALGYDQKPSHEQLKKELEEKIQWRGKIVRIKPLNESVFKTTKIREKISNK